MTILLLLVTGGRGVGDYVGDNNNDDVANDNNNNDNGKNNDNNNNDNSKFDDKQTYNDEDTCAMCLNKFVGSTPEHLSISGYDKKCKAILVDVLSINSCKHKFHRICWMRYETNISRKNNLLKCLTCRKSLLYCYCISKNDCTFDDTATAAKKITSDATATTTAANDGDDDNNKKESNNDNINDNNNDDDVANDNNNNDNGKNNDKNNNDNSNFDDKQNYNDEDACAMCLNKFVGTTPEALSIKSYDEFFKATIVDVLSIISCKYKFHRICWMRYETNISRNNK